MHYIILWSWDYTAPAGRIGTGVVEATGPVISTTRCGLGRRMPSPTHTLVHRAEKKLPQKAGAAVHVIIVTHNNRKHILACLRALPAALGRTPRDLPAHVIIVDTASSDGTPDLVAAAFPHLPLLRLKNNAGWARAINLAAREIADDLLLLNPDTVPMPGSLRTLAHSLAEHPGAGAVGPALITPTGAIAGESARAFPTLWHELTDKLGLTRRWPGHPLWGRYHMGRDTRPRPVPVLSGAALLVRRSAWADVNGLDETFWLYAADTDLCRRLWQAGWQCLYRPDARVLHLGGGSVSPASRVDMGIIALDAMCHYFRKHRGRTYALAYRGLMALIALGKIPYWAIHRSRHHLDVQGRVIAWALWRKLWRVA